MADSVALAPQQVENKQQAPICSLVSGHPAQDGSDFPSNQLPEQKAANTTPSAEQANRPSRKKDRLQAELDQTRRWDIKRKLASITADVEILSQEVARVRTEADCGEVLPELSAADKAILAEKHTKRVADLQKRSCATILRDIMGHKWAFPFNKPVDVNTYRDYLTRVTTPMDFGTIKRKLDAGHYPVAELFAVNMRQVFTNAHTYNAPGTDVWSMANTLKDKFEERYSSMLAKLADQDNVRQADEVALQRRYRESLQARALQGLEVHRQRLSSTFEALEGRILEGKTESAAACKPMSLQEKQAVLDDLVGLKAEDFEFAINLLANRYPKLVSHVSEDLDLDVSPMDALTLRQLAAFQKFAQKGRTSESPTWPGLLFGAGARGFLPSQQKRQRQNSWAPAAGNLAGATPPPHPQRPGPGLGGAKPGPAEPDAAVSAHPNMDSNAGEGRGDVVGEPPADRKIGQRTWSMLDRMAMGAEAEQRDATCLGEDMQEGEGVRQDRQGSDGKTPGTEAVEVAVKREDSEHA